MKKFRLFCSLLFVFSFSLIVCVVPVSAAKVDHLSGSLDIPSWMFVTSSSSATVIAAPFNDLPTNFVFDRNQFFDVAYIWQWNYSEIENTEDYLLTRANYVATIEIPLSSVDPYYSSEVNVRLDNFQFIPNALGWSPDYDVLSPTSYSFTGNVSLYFDDTLILSDSYSSTYFSDIFLTAEGACCNSIRIVYESTNNSIRRAPRRLDSFEFRVVADSFTVDGVTAPVDDFNLVLRTLDDLKEITSRMETTLTDISGNVSLITSDVMLIRDTVTETVTDLKNPNGSIWSAAKEAIGEKIESLFVPTSESVEEALQPVRDVIDEKLGGAKEAGDIVTDTIGGLAESLKNPSASKFTFPGISVPAAGMVGPITFIEEQEVDLDPKIAAVLHPVCTVIIGIISALAVINNLHDLFIFLLSGASYAEFLQRNRGESVA